MGRPAKSAKNQNSNLTKQEVDARASTEVELRGDGECIQPAYVLSRRQRAIFNYIVAQYAAIKVLGNLDSYVLTMTAVAIDRVSMLDKDANKDPSLILNPRHGDARKKYMSDFWRGCNELCLSPQSRAKIGIAAAQAAKAKDPLAEALLDDD